jgi:hypothetical protein
MKRLFCAATTIASLALLTAPVHAQSNFYVPPGGIGSWGDTTNWTLGHLPQTGETAILNSGRDATIDVVNPSPFQFLRIADNDTAAVDGTLHIKPGASLNVAAQVLLAAGGPSDNKGIVDQTGGTLTVGDALFIAFDPPHTGIYNISGGTVTTGNLWFRFGNGTLNQTGGAVNATNLILAEGGNPFTSSVYNLSSGQFNVASVANIGKAPGAGDPFVGSSHGSMNISGGVATFGNLLFGLDPTDQIHMSGAGILRVNQTNYSQAAAMADIASGKITGAGLVVTTFNSGNGVFTQISAVPEPTSLACSLFGLGVVGSMGRRKQRK